MNVREKNPKQNHYPLKDTSKHDGIRPYRNSAPG